MYANKFFLNKLEMTCGIFAKMIKDETIGINNVYMDL